MKKTNQFVLWFAILAMTIVSCAKDEDQNLNLNQENSSVNSEKIAKNIVKLMQNNEAKTTLITYLKENKFGASLETVLNQVDTDQTSKQALFESVSRANELNKLADETGVIEIPELWMYQPLTKKASEALVAYVPKGDEKDWEQIKAFDQDGNVVYLDPNKEPDVPVIVVELNGMETLKARVDKMNEELRAAGLQTKNSDAVRLKNQKGLETTKIEKISLRDDKEPWIKGAAEIYAITSGIKGTIQDKKAEIAIVAMPYLDYAETTYTPNQVILFWNDYAYQAANIQLYEQDSNYNYKQLVSIIVNGVFEIAGLLSGEPWVSALGKIASAIVKVMPDKWYTDDDDYVDSYYTIMKNKEYINYNAAGNNAKATLKPLFIPAN
ncbi:MAG: DUF3103 domain-containing protein [Bacteroidales bacterium]|nr:DUF3103 domain-containing protein [Bacteroidales bacterium]